MHELLNHLTTFVDGWRGNPALPLVFVGLFLAIGIVHISPWVLVLEAGAMMPAPLSLAVAYVGINLTANAYFFVGKLIGTRVLARFIPKRVQALMDQAGFESVLLVRLVPVLPFFLVTMAFGASGLRWRWFALATAIGVLPGVVALTLFAERALDVVRHPTWQSVAVLVAAAAALVVCVVVIKRVVVKRALRIAPVDAAHTNDGAQ